MEETLMDNHTATEQAYKNGYADGKKECEQYLFMAFKYLEIKSIVQGFFAGLSTHRCKRCSSRRNPCYRINNSLGRRI
jgi:hypothetical protein